MAIIGTFTKDGAGYVGTIETLALKAKITFDPQEKRSGKAPDFRVFQIADGFTSEIGAAWKKKFTPWVRRYTANTLRSFNRRTASPASSTPFASR